VLRGRDRLDLGQTCQVDRAYQALAEQTAAGWMEALCWLAIGTCKDGRRGYSPIAEHKLRIRRYYSLWLTQISTEN
jgi:hypothetical protein